MVIQLIVFTEVMSPQLFKLQIKYIFVTYRQLSSLGLISGFLGCLSLILPSIWCYPHLPLFIYSSMYTINLIPKQNKSKNTRHYLSDNLNHNTILLVAQLFHEKTRASFLWHMRDTCHSDNFRFDCQQACGRITCFVFNSKSIIQF